ncbi:uncharacterized protein UTRI_03996 [Ustilago trichophora]|uniref:Uncharacterized protein n=1 Tax=Ustilago trichophora TaxID=86804 RepID=A0A5C3E9S4_9BASI|nr:uncharacterized protein UTRI_03996 [Ustilago trichophora]
MCDYQLAKALRDSSIHMRLSRSGQGSRVKAVEGLYAVSARPGRSGIYGTGMLDVPGTRRSDRGPRPICSVPCFVFHRVDRSKQK